MAALGQAAVVRGEGETLRHALHVIAVAHPGHALGRQAGEEGTAGIKERIRAAVLPRRVLLGRYDAPAQVLGHELAAVADAEHGYAEPEDSGVRLRRVRRVYAARASGEDEADGPDAAQLLYGRGVRLHLTVDAALAHPARYELVILSSEVKYDDRFLSHTGLFLSFPRISRGSQ